MRLFKLAARLLAESGASKNQDVNGFFGCILWGFVGFFLGLFENG